MASGAASHAFAFVAALALSGASLDADGASLEHASYSLTLDPVISREFPTSEAVYHPARGSQRDPTVAWNGSQYLVAWSDERDASTTGWDIYAARVNADGAIMDPGGIPVARSPGDQGEPTIASDGTNFLVVWSGESEAHSSVGVFGARVSSTGQVLDAPEIAISTTGNERSPAAAWNGSSFLVVWDFLDFSTGDLDIYGARVDATGALLDPSRIPISTVSGSHETEPAIASVGTDFLVAWVDWRNLEERSLDVFAARVTGAGQVLDASGIEISSTQAQEDVPTVASDGSKYLVAWDSLRRNDSDIYGTFVEPDRGGTQLGHPIAISHAVNHQSRPSAAWNGSSFLVVWADLRRGDHDVFGARLTVAGRVLDPRGIPVLTGPGTDVPAGLAADLAGYLLVEFRVATDPSFDVFALRIGADGQSIGDPYLVSRQATEQTAPAAAWDGSTYLVVWQEYGEGSNFDVYGARVTEGGTSLDGRGILVSGGPGFQGHPSVAATTAGFFVVWEDSRADGLEIRGARFAPDGTNLDPDGILVSLAAGSHEAPAVASDGSRFLVTWAEKSPRLGIFGQLVSGAGTLEGSDIVINAAAALLDVPSVAWSGSNYLVVWEEARFSARAEIRGARVAPDGRVLDQAPVGISGPTAGITAPSVASDGASWLVVWDDARNVAESRFDIYGARVGGDGTVIDTAGIAITQAPSEQRFPALAFDGTEYLVSWEDFRSGICEFSSCRDGEILGTRIGTDGAMLDASPIHLAPGTTDEYAPALVAGPVGDVGLSYWRVAREPTYGGVGRVFLRVIQT